MYKLFLKQLILLVHKSSIMVGGQAVMEGVMMRVPGFYATAVRTQQGLIQTQRESCIPSVDLYNMQKAPIIRGFLHLVDSMRIGFKTLEWSAKIVDPEEAPSGKLTNFFTSIASILFTIMLFMGIPYVLTEYGLQSQGHLANNQFNFNIFAGFIRILIFLLYLIILSQLKEIKTLFEYHGAEHKVVYNFESGQKLNIQNAQKFSTKHPRCGTSFIFILMIVTIFTYSIIDSLFVYMTLFQLTIPSRIFLHLCCLPIVSGIGYEVLKFLAKRQNTPLFHYLSLPGLWLQHITTNEPNKDQLEVSITALRCAFSDDIDEYEGQQFQADAIG